MSALYNSRVLEALRERGRVVNLGGRAVHEVALEAARSAGYNEALDDLVYFKERFIDTAIVLDQVPMDFSALANLVKSGVLTQEEADAIRQGKQPNYDKFTKPAPADRGS